MDVKKLKEAEPLQPFWLGYFMALLWGSAVVFLVTTDRVPLWVGILSFVIVMIPLVALRIYISYRRHRGGFCHTSCEPSYSVPSAGTWARSVALGGHVLRDDGREDRRCKKA